MNKKGNLIVISGPSGCGKGTVLNDFFSSNPDMKIGLSISATTRAPREGEVDGVNYYFVSKEEFEKKINNNGLLEWACFCDNYYGTPLDAVLERLENGIDVVLEIEVQGAMKVKEKVKDACMVFILPPSLSVLEKRLIGRGTESEDSLKKRIETAKVEILLASEYDYVIINNDVKQASEDFKTIVKSLKFKVENNLNNINEVCKL